MRQSWRVPLVVGLLALVAVSGLESYQDEANESDQSVVALFPIGEQFVGSSSQDSLDATDDAESSALANDSGPEISVAGSGLDEEDQLPGSSPDADDRSETNDDNDSFKLRGFASNLDADVGESARRGSLVSGIEVPGFFHNAREQNLDEELSARSSLNLNGRRMGNRGFFTKVGHRNLDYYADDGAAGAAGDDDDDDNDQSPQSSIDLENY